jgi:hypothetical protein
MGKFIHSFDNKKLFNTEFIKNIETEELVKNEEFNIRINYIDKTYDYYAYHIKAQEIEKALLKIVKELSN